jgi:hypothetical protein
MQLNRKYIGCLTLAAIALFGQDKLRVANPNEPSTTTSSSQQKPSDVSGPFCWAGNDGGKNRYIPCGHSINSGSGQSWLTVDLSYIAGIHVIVNGKTVDITSQGLRALAGSPDGR